MTPSAPLLPSDLNTHFVGRLRARDAKAWFELWETFGPVLRAQLSRWGRGKVGIETVQDLSQEMRRATGATVGVVVTRVLPGSGAADIGIEVGDVVTDLRRHALRDKAFAMRVLDHYRREPYLDVHIYRPSEGEQYGGELPLSAPR